MLSYSKKNKHRSPLQKWVKASEYVSHKKKKNGKNWGWLPERREHLGEVREPKLGSFLQIVAGLNLKR